MSNVVYIDQSDDKFLEAEGLRARIRRLERVIIKLELEIAWLMSLDEDGCDRNLTIKTISDMVCAKTGTNIVELRTPRRQYGLCTARHILMLLARNYTTLSLPKIGKYINKDHTSVIHGIRKIQERMKVEEPLKKLVEELSNDIRTLALISEYGT